MFRKDFMEKYAAIILGAGKGTRMNEGQASPIPKVMFKVYGKPIIYYAVNALKQAGIKKIVLIVGYRKEMIMEFFGNEVEYAEQKEQLGTGHAAMMAKDQLEGQAESIIITNGDHALYMSKTIKELIKYYKKEKPTIAMLSVVFQDPMYWAFGRIIRDKNGEVQGIIEQKDCTHEQLKIRESNPNFYIIKADWFWQNISKITTNNVQKEYYVTDIITIAKQEGKRIVAMPISKETEAIGINTPDQLKIAEEVLKKRK